jgi:hypothetical protein
MISGRSSSGDKIRKLVGRLNHVAFVIPAARHFVGGIRHFEEISYPTTKAIRQIPRGMLEDLSSSLDFLERTQRGISLNILTIREPTKHGMCFMAEPSVVIPLDLLNHATLNVLELFASIIGPWVDSREGNLPEFSCVWS